MGTKDKYQKLGKFLLDSEKNIVTLSFRELEEILGFSLPESLYLYPSRWTNSISQSPASTWMKVGYRRKSVSLTNKEVVFIRVSDSSEKSNKINLLAEDAIAYIDEYYETGISAEYGRFLSWNLCYEKFIKFRHTSDEATIDYLAMNLACYLSSWGMYRGSSFLLQMNYQVYIPVVKIIMESKYDVLVGIDAEALLTAESLALIEEIGDRIREYFAHHTPEVKMHENHATDTLITKILLGTLGCVPAFDQYLVKGLHRYSKISGRYSMETIVALAGYYCEHRETFEVKRQRLSENLLFKYPAMKLMDMCFWQAGRG